MKIEFDTNEGNMGTSYPVSNRVTADFRLDEQLDTGSVVIITDSAEPIPPMTPSRLTFSDDEAVTRRKFSVVFRLLFRYGRDQRTRLLRP